MMARNHPMMVKRYKKLIDDGAMGSYADGLMLEAASDKTFYQELTDLKATLEDGAAKFQDMVAWVASRQSGRLCGQGRGVVVGYGPLR